MQQYRMQLERRRRNIRLILGAIIVITLPFYCAGVILWGTAPQRGVQATPNLPPVTNTAIIVPTVGGSVTATFISVPTVTSFPITIGVPPVTISFPTQPPTIAVPTRFLSPTPTFLPLPTAIPTNIPPPPPPPPTDTPEPLPFDPLLPP